MTILAITPNPSIDKCVVVKDFQLGRIHRPERVLNLAGGKGLNVARTVRLLGGCARACLILAGHSGHWIADQLAGEGIQASIVWAKGETRVSTSIVDPVYRRLTEIYEPGEPIESDTWPRFESALDEALPDVAWATISGSLPPGAPEDGIARIVEIAHSRHCPAIVDARDEYLVRALRAGPDLVKINQEEARHAAGIEVQSLQTAAEAGAIIRRAGAHNVIITLGEQGAVGLWENEVYWGRISPIQPVAPVGSGDAFLGGLALSLSKGEPFIETLRTAISAGAANALTLGAGMLDPNTVKELKTQVEIKLLGESLPF